MKISLEWLSDFVSWKERDPLVIADRITRSTGEVEEVMQQGSQLEKCCVGKILTVAKHPGADRLSLCEVKTDQGVKKVVCGGSNLRQGMRVAFAHVGSQVKWHGEEMMTLQKTKIRGEESEGMICAAEELGLADLFPTCTSHSIVDLGDGDEGVGQTLRSYLGLNDAVLHIDNHAITNRPDLFSHIGCARECAALGLATWKKVKIAKKPAFPKTALPFGIVLEQKKLVPRYCGCTLSFAALGETPAWMKRRLEAVGLRSLTLPVDITNYVTVELGMPLHSFDIDDLKGDIHIRASKEGETIKTLDDVDRVLPAGAVVMSDDRGIFDLMGIMGGLRSSTQGKTRHIYLHSPVVDPVSIRTGVVGTGHRTDAATIYEKGVPPVMAEQGLFRALQLFLSLVPGAQITSRLQSWGSDGTPKAIAFSHKDAERLLGIAIPEKTTKKILIDLGFKVSRSSVTPPLWRMGDIHGAHDLSEEVGRIFGYDRIIPAIPAATVAAPPRDHRLNGLRAGLAALGFAEVVPLSILGKDLLLKCRLPVEAVVSISNPLGEEVSLLQTSTLPRLLEHAGRNMLAVEDHLKTFTCSHIFPGHGQERYECGAVIASRRDASLMQSPFLLLKQAMLDQLRGAGYDVSIRSPKQVHVSAHPGRSCELMVGTTLVGSMFEVHPSVRTAFDLPARAAAALLDLSALLSLPAPAQTFRTTSSFPAITYDLTMTLDANRSAGDILQKIRNSSPLLEDVVVADLYDGSSLPKGSYNLTVRCTYRATDRTLTEEEAKKAHESALALVS